MPIPAKVVNMSAFDKRIGIAPQSHCPNCGSEYARRLLFWLPKDIDLLANALGLPAETVVAWLSSGQIPVRYSVDSLGRRRKTVVWLADALEAIRASGRDTK